MIFTFSLYIIQGSFLHVTSQISTPSKDSVSIPIIKRIWSF